MEIKFPSRHTLLPLLFLYHTAQSKTVRCLSYFSRFPPLTMISIPRRERETEVVSRRIKTKITSHNLYLSETWQGRCKLLRWLTAL